MHRIFLLSLFFWVILLPLASCKTKEAQPEPAPATPIGEVADTARQAERGSTAQRDSKQIASLEAMLARVERVSKEAWASELGIMRKRYGEMKAAPSDKAEAEKRAEAWATGQIEVSRSLAAEALAEATKQAAAAAKATADRIEAERREKESRAANEQLLKDKDAQIAKLEQLVKSRQVTTLNVAGVLCVLATGALLYFGPRALGAFTGLTAVCCFGIARLIAKPWFETAFNCTLGGLILAGIIVSVYEWRRKVRLAEEAKEKDLHLKAGDDVISGVEEIRAMLKDPPATLVEAVRSADTAEKALLAVKHAIGGAVNGKLREWVTEEDGTAAVVDARRRKLKLVK